MEQIMKMGAWSPEEDQKLKTYIMRFGIWNWNLMPKFAGLSRTGKSCRLRWMNYLRPDVKRGPFTIEERETVIKMYLELGNRWSAIAARLPGRTDNEVKNFFHTHLKKHLGVKNMDVPARRRKSVSKKIKSRKAHEKTPLLFLDNNPITSSCNNSLMLSPDVSSISTTSSSIITFDQNQKILENTVILESNPATTTHDQLLSIESLDEFDTNSFWLLLLNDAHRLIL